jgi:hypothetical protein
MASNRIILGLGMHRPEMIPALGKWMGSCDMILLEEPSSPYFTRMLAGGIRIHDYLMHQDLEYPLFSERMCRLLQGLYAQKKAIHQVEPYLETLAGIHDLFADGFRAADIAKNSVQHQVYVAEHNATGALLDFYDIAVSGTFRKTIEAVKHFARQDAARFRLRDILRAQALIAWVKNRASVFIEAGQMHYLLRKLLLRNLDAPERLQTVFLADALLKGKGVRNRLYGPGDQLTLLYVFHPELKWPEREALLAARALVYNKLIEKNEREDSEGLPHLLDEQACIQMVGKLSLDDCGRLFPLIRNIGCQEALSIVRNTGANS